MNLFNIFNFSKKNTSNTFNNNSSLSLKKITLRELEKELENFDSTKSIKTKRI
ncbi:MAG: hypothetical protein LAT82_05010 [Nanoarchaeota archaeon]|nr:hypothetical protein [Nanoarchaeota archaeon]